MKVLPSLGEIAEARIQWMEEACIQPGVAEEAFSAQLSVKAWMVLRRTADCSFIIF